MRRVSSFESTRREAIKTGAVGIISIAISGDSLAATLSNSNNAFDDFVSPPDSMRPWVYWYFTDGHLSAEGMAADLDAMKQAGIGGAIYLEVDLGLERGPINFMSKPWQSLIAGAFEHADDLGIEISMATGPGWCGTGGPWVKPEDSMQILVGSDLQVRGPTNFNEILPRPKPRAPFFGLATLTPELHKIWEDFYVDEFVLAFPTPASQAMIDDIAEKALYTRGAYTSSILGPYTTRPWVRPFLPTLPEYPALETGYAINKDQVLDLTDKLAADGSLLWQVPEGSWTIMRFGRTITAHVTRPAPLAGLGLETDKFSAGAIDKHFKDYIETLLKKIRPRRRRGRGLTTFHFDSWEMGSQNWTAQFQDEFEKRRGYDPLIYLPTFSGYVVGSHESSERFLWDVRQTAQELVIEKHILRLREHLHRSGMQLSMQMYDLNPTSDLQLGSPADVPMGEFWSKDFGFLSDFSVIEAASVGHTNGRRVIGAEAFTADTYESWLQHPASMKDQGDWALCAGINRFVFHRFQAQPANGRSPGMTFGPKGGFGVHWDRTQTWWDMVPAYHKYISRCQQMLRRGHFVADILYLIPEGAPHVFLPPGSAFLPGKMGDRRGYNFDGCAPEALINRGSVRDGKIVFPDGMSYRLLVLPRVETMTPRLLQKIEQLVAAGAIIMGLPPRKSPSLEDYPRCDQQVQAIARRLWGEGKADSVREVGKGQLWRDPYQRTTEQDNPLANAKWIWPSDGGSTVSGDGYFSYDLKVADTSQIVEAEIIMGGCASFEVSVNGQWIGSGQNHQAVERFDFTSVVKSGLNKITVKASWSSEPANEPDIWWGRKPERLAPGLIGAIILTSTDQRRQVVTTDESWISSLSANGARSKSKELGDYMAAPWNLTATAIKQATLYPSYRMTEKILSSLGIPPDFEGSDNVRFIHRRDGPEEIYFVGNRTGNKLTTKCTFRVNGRQPEWWNAVTGEKRSLPESVEKGGLTTIPFQLEPFESGFVVFRKPARSPALKGTNFPIGTPLLAIAGPWEVSFDPKWGGPPMVVFPELKDWIESSDPRVRYYSGKAVYRARFDIAGLDTEQSHYLSLGRVKNMAKVTLNGHDLGTVWCNPWEIKIPNEFLQVTANYIEITVANLWVNRLVGDSGLPVDKRITWTPDGQSMPRDTPLQSSGLLGPVTLQSRKFDQSM